MTTLLPAETTSAPNRLLPFTFENLPARGRLLRLTGLNTHVPSLSQAPLHLRHSLAELLTTAALLVTDSRKSAAQPVAATLQVQHAGLGLLMFAHCGRDGTLKAYGNAAAAEHPFASLTDHPEPGIFAITLEPEAPDAYTDPRMQSLIPLSHATISRCVEDYFTSAVQTPTLLRVFSSTDADGTVNCGALFLQKLPEAPLLNDDEIDDDWTRMRLLLETLTPEEVLPGGPAEATLLHRLFAEDDVRLFLPEEFTFQADNPRPRMRAALAALPVAELRELLAPGSVTLTDETSGRAEVFMADELTDLLNPDDTPAAT